ncbi:MAG: STAS domain-containing protein [bacterium]
MSIIEKLERDGGVTVITVRGNLDISTRDGLREEIFRLIDGGDRNLVIDLGKVTYSDSSGIMALVEVERRAREAGGRAALLNVRVGVRRTIDLIGMKKYFDFYRNKDEAIASFR